MMVTEFGRVGHVSPLAVSACVFFLQRQCGRAQEEGGRGARAGEAERPDPQSVLRIRREVWSGEGSNGQGLHHLLNGCSS